MVKAGEATGEQADLVKMRGGSNMKIPLESDNSGTSAYSSDSRREEKVRLQQIRDDVENLDGRLSNWQKNMAVGGSVAMRDRLDQIKEEKGETEQMLEDLRGKLEEHKRLTKPKKRPPKPKFAKMSSASEDDLPTRGLSSENESHESAWPSQGAQDNRPVVSPDEKGSGLKKRPPAPKFRGSADGVPKTASADLPPKIQSSSLSLADLNRGVLDESIISGRTEATDSEKDVQESDKEVEELEEMINGLEKQKEEIERTLVELFETYEGKTSTLQKEKQRISDDKDTTYAEMKGLLIEQHEEAERLRLRLVRLEKKRRTFLFFAKTFVLIVLLALVGGATYVKYYVEDITEIIGSLNYVCAPVKPGTKITESNGVVEAPWWAPRYTKHLFFPLLCEGRRRIQLEIRRGTLWIIEQPQGTVISKKTAHWASIESERIFVSDRGGGHQEFDSPWAVPEDQKAAKTRVGNRFELPKLW